MCSVRMGGAQWRPDLSYPSQVGAIDHAVIEASCRQAGQLPICGEWVED